MNRAAVILLLLAALGCCRAALADGGAVITSGTSSGTLGNKRQEWQTTLLVSPNVPTEGGPADFGVAILDSETGVPIEDLNVVLTLLPHGKLAPKIVLDATRAASTNKLFYGAQCDLPEAGLWEISAKIIMPGEPETSYTMIGGTFGVSPPWPKWLELWPWLAVPGVMIVLFLLRELLVQGQRSRRARINSRPL